MKQKYHYTLLIASFILLTTNIQAQYKSSDFFHKFLVGKINNRIKVRMVLTKQKRGKSDKNNLSGYYYIPRKRNMMMLKNGTWKDNGSMLMEEGKMVQGKYQKTGAFSGRWDDVSKKLIGTWTAIGGKKSYSFELYETYRKGGLAAGMKYLDETTAIGKNSPRGVSMSFLYPEIQGGNLANRINQFIKDSLLKNPAQRIKKFVKEYVDFKKENGSNSIYFNEENYITVNTNEKNIFTLEYNQSGYTGGAHGYYNTQFVSFDLKNNKMIQLKNVLKKGFEKPLQDLIAQQMRLDSKLKPGESLTKIGLYKDSPPIAKNFYFRPDGIGFYYNAYEIAPYAAGPRLTVIPYKKIKKYVNRRSVLKKFIR